MKVHFLFLLLLLMVGAVCKAQTAKGREMLLKINMEDNKLVIYQMMVRLFGNKNTSNKFYGSKEENGAGKFNDITGKALDELKKLGITHVWYTGVIEHATMTDYSAFGIKPDDPDVVKGRAGSPYAIKDYYDVDPDLATDVNRRMEEFEDLVKRTHVHGLKVIIDFVPNHVARTYHSDAMPAGIKDFGADDDTTRAFDPQNDFYYIPGKSFIVPEGVNAGGDGFKSPMKDGKFDESPAKATGNNIFSEKPSINDWYETIKLNYGTDYQHAEKKYFDPIPSVWLKMRDILLFWAKKDVDGFRCDMAEMVPAEFWHWVIPQVKKVNPGLIFIAEAYDPKVYQKYLTTGKFDFLYDKSGLYDGLKKLIRNEPGADVKVIREAQKQVPGYSSHLLRFLENHDEERIASDGFAKDPWLAVPGMVVSATLSGGPVMIYFGQEVGEPGKGKEGFGKDDNRTSIFDYWGVPEHQKWMNNGKFDGGQLSGDQKKLRDFYSRLLNFSASDEAIREGAFQELNDQKSFNNRMYAYIRYTDKSRVLVIANFDRKQTLKASIQLPAELIRTLHLLPGHSVEAEDILNGGKTMIKNVTDGIPVKVMPSGAVVWKL